jgi:hypothetical protein
VARDVEAVHADGVDAVLAVIRRLEDRIEELERRLNRDSGNSSMPRCLIHRSRGPNGGVRRGLLDEYAALWTLLSAVIVKQPIVASLCGMATPVAAASVLAP